MGELKKREIERKNKRIPNIDSVRYNSYKLSIYLNFILHDIYILYLFSNEELTNNNNNLLGLLNYNMWNSGVIMYLIVHIQFFF